MPTEEDKNVPDSPLLRKISFVIIAFQQLVGSFAWAVVFKCVSCSPGQIGGLQSNEFKIAASMN